MRILHLNNEKTWRGGERQTFLLAQALEREGVPGGIACRPAGRLWQHAAERCIDVKMLSGNAVRAVAQLAGLAKGYDLLHCHTGRSHSLAALTYALHRRPFLVTRRVDFLPDAGWFNRYKFGRAAQVVCISRFIADQLAEWGVRRERLSVIGSAVPPPDPQLLTAEHRAAARARFGIAEDVKLVGNIAAMVGHKDQATLLRAAKVLKERRPEVRVVILGDGELKESLLAQRRELGLEEQVLMPGFVPQAEQFLPAFDVFVMSSCMEGLGSIVLDAFAAGVPVAATAGGGLPEIVRHEETGLLAPVGGHIELAQAILRLLDEPEVAARLRATASDWVRQAHSVEAMARSYRKLYERLLAQ